MKKGEKKRKTEEIRGKYSLKWNKNENRIHNFTKISEIMYILFANA